MLIKKFLQTFTVIGLLLSMPTVITDAEAQKRLPPAPACSVACQDKVEACLIACKVKPMTGCTDFCRATYNNCIKDCPSDWRAR
jgi:hypothetical protein